MPAKRLNFKQWKARALEAPGAAVDRYLEALKQLSPETSRAIIASHPGREALVSALTAACAEEAAPLCGVPYLLQDLFDVCGLPTACGAPLTDLFDAPADAPCLLDLKLKTLGGCFFGKTVPAEFGVDQRGSNPTFGECPHVDGLRYACGGGAGASAHAVAEGWVPLAFGLDTCGGVRIPAAFHGLFGFRMGTNDFAREGVFPIAPSIESVGWVTGCLDDLLASFLAFHPFPAVEAPQKPRGYLLTELAAGPLEPSLKASLMQLVHGLNIDEDLPLRRRLLETFEYGGEALSVIENRELYSIHKYWIEEYQDQYAPALLQRIEQGRDCQTAEAEKATLIQDSVRAGFAEFFLEYDYLVLPVSQIPTPEKADWSPEVERDLSQLCAPASLAFLPALILPVPCADGWHGAAQVIIHPRKLHLVPKILTQVARYYASSSME